MTGLETWTDQFKSARQAARSLGLLDASRVSSVLNAVAARAEECIPGILDANQVDLSSMDINDPRYDRLKLTPERIRAIAAEIRQVATLPSPLGRTLESRKLDNG